MKKARDFCFDLILLCMAAGTLKDALAAIDLDAGPDSDFAPIDDLTYSIRAGVF